jgi:hypothetical protein
LVLYRSSAWMLGWKLFGFWLSDIGRYFTFFFCRSSAYGC